MRIRRERSSDVRPGVTVVIPCYRYGRFLDAAVAAVLDQADVEPRVIIVDDASPDDSAQIARRIADADPRVTLIAHERNAGAIATYNEGLAEATTEFVSLVSADDLVAPGALGRATRLMLAEPGVGMVYGLPLEFEDDGPVPLVPPSAGATWTIWRGQEWIRLACRRGRNFILSPEVVMRTEAMRSIGPYNPALPHSSDLEYWLRTAARWDVARVNGPVQALYRVHGQNMHLTQFSAAEDDLSRRAEAFRILAVPGVRQLLDRPDALVERADRAIAREALLLAQRKLDQGGEPDEAARLFAAAARLHAPSVSGPRGRAIVRRLRRVDAGDAAPLRYRGLEFIRSQLDRVRWTVWRWAGVS